MRVEQEKGERTRNLSRAGSGSEKYESSQSHHNEAAVAKAQVQGEVTQNSAVSSLPFAVTLQSAVNLECACLA